MKVKIEDAIKAWGQATDRDVIQAATKDKNSYLPEIQKVIEGEIENRGLQNEVELEMARLSKKLAIPKSQFNVAGPHRKATRRRIARIVVGGILVFSGVVLASNISLDHIEGKTITEAIFFPPNFGGLVSLLIGGLWYDRLGKMELRGPLALTIGTVVFFVFLFFLMMAVAITVVWYRGQERLMIPVMCFLLAAILLLISHVLSFTQWKPPENNECTSETLQRSSFDKET